MIGVSYCEILIDYYNKDNLLFQSILLFIPIGTYQYLNFNNLGFKACGSSIGKYEHCGTIFITARGVGTFI